jgi:hypothetical protein
MSLKTATKSAISTVGELHASLGARVSAIWQAFDIKPTFFLGGLGAVGYGLYLNFSLGTSLIFVGGVFMTVGYLMGGKS